MDHKIKSIIGYVLMIIIFGAIALFILNHYNVLTAEKTTAKVMVKKSEKGLYTAPRYYIYTLSKDTGLSKLALNRDLFFNVNEDEQISGYQTASGFYTEKSPLKNVGISLLLFVLVALILVGVLGLISVFSKHPRLRVLGKVWPRLFTFKSILAILAIVAIIYTGKLALQSYQKTAANEHADAIITSKNANFSGRGYRSIAHTTYTFSLKFDDQDGNETKVIQTVYKKTYDKYEENAKIPIVYQEGNPYNVFLPERRMFDWFYFTPNMIYIYLLLGFAIFICGSVMKNHRKDKQSRESQVDVEHSANSNQHISQNNATKEEARLKEWGQAFDLIKEYEDTPDKTGFSTTEVEQAYNIVEGRKNVTDEINLAYLWETFWKCGIWSSMVILFSILIKEFTFIWIIVLFTILFPFSKLVFDQLLGFRMHRKINLSPKWRHASVVDNLFMVINICLFAFSILLAPIGILYLLTRSIIRRLRK